MSEKAKNRIEWLDCAKGFAIILVVYGHALTYFSPNFDNVVHVIYSFHMPLFFVLTGYVSAYSYNSVNFNTFSKKKINALMKPYLWYGVVLFAFKFLTINEQIPKNAQKPIKASSDFAQAQPAKRNF